jgi:hypothetical protein
MNEKNPLQSLVIMDLGLSLHYAQVLTIAVELLSNMPHRTKRKTF